MPGLREEMKVALSESMAEPAAEAAALKLDSSKSEQGFYRIGEVPHYSPDALCRRSTPLQETVQADSFFVGLNPDDASKLKLQEGDSVKVKQPSSGEADAELPVRLSERVPSGAIWLRSGTCGTRYLGAAMGLIELETNG